MRGKVEGYCEKAAARSGESGQGPGMDFPYKKHEKGGGGETESGRPGRKIDKAHPLWQKGSAKAELKKVVGGSK